MTKLLTGTYQADLKNGRIVLPSRFGIINSVLWGGCKEAEQGAELHFRAQPGAATQNEVPVMVAAGILALPEELSTHFSEQAVLILGMGDGFIITDA